MNPWIPHLLRASGGGGGPVLPPTGRTMLANLTSSLILDEGAGNPAYSMATPYWGTENDLGLLRQYPAGSAFFGWARLVRNTVRTKSEDFSNAAWAKDSVTVSGTNEIVSANSTAVQGIYQFGSSLSPIVVGEIYRYCIRAEMVPGGVSFIRIEAGVSGFGSAKFANFSLLDGSFVATGVIATSTLVSAGVYDFSIRAIATASGIFDLMEVNMSANINSAYNSVYVGDGVKSFKLLRAWSCNVTGYDASYVPEYIPVGVVAAPFFGDGIDGAKCFETDWQGAPIAAANLKGLLDMPAAMNNLLYCRDLSNAAWSTKTNITAAKTATGIDGIANTATTLTATAADAIILQPITLASAARCASAYVRRRTGTGTVSFTQDGGSTWTPLTFTGVYGRGEITSTLANPSVGFKISTSGDAIDVDVVQNEAGTVATPPIITTTATVSRGASSLTYQTATNWSDTAGTAFIEAEPGSWSVVSGGAVGSATNGLLLSSANSGATAYDGTNAANGPVGVPSGKEKLAMRWTGAVLDVASSGALGTPGIYDGGMGLSSIAVGAGVNVPTYFKNLAIYSSVWTDDEIKANVT